MTRVGDIPLVTKYGKNTSVLEVLDELRQAWSKAEPARARARAMERWVYNRFNGKSVALESMVSLPLNVPPVSKNKLRSILLTWAARTTKQRDTAIAYANEATEADIAKAEVANAILDYQRQQQDRDALMMRAMITAGMHGMIGMYNPYDPDAGPHKEREVVLDPLGFPMRDAGGALLYRDVPGRGNPTLEALSIFDFVTSGEKESQTGKWALIRRWLDPDEAECLLKERSKELGVADFNVNIEQVQTRQSSGPTREAVEAWEIWWRPGKKSRFVEGLFATVISGVVVEASTFPYEHGEIPLVMIRVMDVEDDFYGATWMEDAVPQQMGLNHSLSVLAHRAEIAGQVRIMMKNSVAKAWGESMDGVIECATSDDVENGAKAFETPDIPVDMYQMADRYEQGIDDTAGVAAVSSSGDVAAATKNARLVAYATQVDELKNEHTIRNLQEGELAIDSQQLKLFQQFVPLQRLIRVVGEDNAVAANYFSGAEIRGVDVQLYSAPGSERTRAAKAQAAEEGTAAGFIDPKAGAEMRNTGLGGTVDQGEMRQRVHLLIQQAMSGQPAQADMSIDPNVAIKELRLAVERFGHDQRIATPLRSLLLQYMDMASQSAMPASPPAGPQPPQGKPGVLPMNKPPINQLPMGAPQ